MFPDDHLYLFSTISYQLSATMREVLLKSKTRKTLKTKPRFRFLQSYKKITYHSFYQCNLWKEKFELKNSQDTKFNSDKRNRQFSIDWVAHQ